VTSVHWANDLEVFAAISPAFAPLLMEPKDNQPDEALNLPVVHVRGVTNSDAWKLYERYNIEFSPPGYAEMKLCEVIIALEEMVMDFTRAEERRRSKNQE
jgi:hypothetical protein